MSFLMFTRVLIVLVTLGNVLALLGGIVLMLAPRPAVKWLGSRNRHPLSLRRLTRPLEKLLDLDGPMLRYSRVLGAAMLAGGLFVLVKWALFVLSVQSATAARGLAALFPDLAWPAALWESIWLMVSALVLLGAVFAIAVGGLALLHTQTLRLLSKIGNRWISTRQAAKPVAKPYYGIDRLIAAHPQAWGGAIALLALYTLAMIVWFSR